jgi:hypothetical protein
MEDSGAASGTRHLVDIPSVEEYSRLVTKDTIVEGQEDSNRMDATGESSDAAEVSPRRDYYEQRHARFMAAIKGELPISEYVQEAVAEVDNRLPPLPSV